MAVDILINAGNGPPINGSYASQRFAGPLGPTDSITGLHRFHSRRDATGHLRIINNDGDGMSTVDPQAVAAAIRSGAENVALDANTLQGLIRDRLITSAEAQQYMQRMTERYNSIHAEERSRTPVGVPLADSVQQIMALREGYEGLSRSLGSRIASAEPTGPGLYVPPRKLGYNGPD